MLPGTLEQLGSPTAPRQQACQSSTRAAQRAFSIGPLRAAPLSRLVSTPVPAQRTFSTDTLRATRSFLMMARRTFSTDPLLATRSFLVAQRTFLTGPLLLTQILLVLRSA